MPTSAVFEYLEQSEPKVNDAYCMSAPLLILLFMCMHRLIIVWDYLLKEKPCVINPSKICNEANIMIVLCIQGAPDFGADQNEHRVVIEKCPLCGVSTTFLTIK